jgi:hypothetical protein
METKDPKEDKFSGGGPETGLLLMGLIGILVSLGLGAAGVTIGSMALAKANDNEDMITKISTVLA